MAEPRPTTLLVPVKAFSAAKARLAAHLGPDERAELARRMAARVLLAAEGMDVRVVCDDDEVATWAVAHGAEVSWQPSQGLNAAVAAAARAWAAEGTSRRLAVVHGDLPLVRSLHWLADVEEGVVLVPDRHGTGTNVISTPTARFRFAYGPGSFQRHVAEAERLGEPLTVIRDSELGWDVDVPADLVGAADLRNAKTGEEP